MDQNTKDKIKGVIFGQAIGDALGLGTEFLSKEQVGELYPNGYNDYSQMVRDKHRKRWDVGSWTDDTDQFLCILDSFMENEDVNEIDIAKRFKNWLDTGGMGIGQTTYKVLTMPQYELFPKKAAKIIWKIKKKDIAPNGGLMRNGIVGTYKYWDREVVLENSRNICQLTHFDPRCTDSCEIVSHIIMGELNAKPIEWNSLKVLIDEYDSRIKEYLIDISDGIDKLKLDEEGNLGYTLKALNAGIWSYYNSINFEQGILNIIHEGGDADTNGCIAGSILGSKFGYSAIPNKWINGLLDREELELRTKKYIEKLQQLRLTDV
jgi:ADP-ribosylglycohydrolase